jgi:hypothetical protein
MTPRMSFLLSVAFVLMVYSAYNIWGWNLESVCVCDKHSAKLDESSFKGVNMFSSVNFSLEHTELQHLFKDSRDPFPITSNSSKIQTEVVVFIPSPVPWEDRRRWVHSQFQREGWSKNKVALLFVFGSRSGEKLKDTVDTSGVVKYPGTENVVVYCRDLGDEPNNPDDTSATTCKVYEALKHIVANYESKYVWRGADDSYLNLPFFFSDVTTSIPSKRVYLGRLRRTDFPSSDLLLSNQPLLRELFGIYQFGQYMSGMGYMLTYDVAEFISSLKIPPHLTWCEDIMVGMWLLPFQITFLNYPGFHDLADGPAQLGKEYLVVHRMKAEQWQRIDKKGNLY